MTVGAAAEGGALRKRNVRGEGSRLRGEILEAAMRILDRAPATELSLRLVAKEAKIAAPSIYPHFASVKALMAEVVRICWQQLGEEMSFASLGPKRSVTVMLKLRVSAYIKYAMDRQSRYQLLFALQPLDVEALRELPGLVRPAYRNVMEAVERIIAERGMLATGDAVETTMLILSLTHGRIALAHTAPQREGNSSASVSRFVLDMLDRILVVDPATMPRIASHLKGD